MGTTTVSAELSRISSAKADIASAIASKGVSVPADAMIDSFGGLIRSIAQDSEGGGSVELIYNPETEELTFGAGLAGDFILECGETNGWEWEKTNGGKSEARKRIQYSVDVNTASGALYRSGIISFSEHPYPTGLFVDIPNVQITITPTDGYITWYGAWESPTNIQPPAIRLLKVLSSTGNTGYINITATGRWKE